MNLVLSKCNLTLNPGMESDILDLYFTTYPSLVKSCYTVKGISNHHMVVVDCDVKPRYILKKHQKYITTKRKTRPISNQIEEPYVCTIPTLLVQLKPNGKTLERGYSKPCHMIYLLNGEATDLIFLG